MVNAREKGKRKELEIAKILNNAFGTNVRRTPCSGGLSIKGDIIDINQSSILSRFHFEIKNQEKLNIWRALSQSQSDCPVGKIPLVVYSKAFEDNYVTLRLNDFIPLLQELEEQRDESNNV